MSRRRLQRFNVAKRKTLRAAGHKVRARPCEGWHSREEFNVTVEIVLKPDSGDLGGAVGDGTAKVEAAGFKWDCKLVAIGCGVAGIAAAKRLLAAYPANCPRTVLVIDVEAATVKNAVSAMRGLDSRDDGCKGPGGLPGALRASARRSYPPASPGTDRRIGRQKSFAPLGFVRM